MKTISIREMRNCDIEMLLETTGGVVLTKNGHKIARILPMQKKITRPTHQELHHLVEKSVTPSEQIIRDMRDER